MWMCGMWNVDQLQNVQDRLFIKYNTSICTIEIFTFSSTTMPTTTDAIYTIYDSAANTTKMIKCAR